MSKFDSDVDQAVYEMSLDGGPDEEVGSSTEAPGTWAGLMRDGKGMADRIESDRDEFPDVTAKDIAFLRHEGRAGAIITETTQGFVSVSYYAKESDLEKDWKEAEETLSVDDEELEPNASNGAHLYSVRYVHKISPSDKDVGPDVRLPGGAFSNSKTLGAALRKAGVLIAGAKVRTFRVEGDKIVVFPSAPGRTTYWHSVILKDLGDEELATNARRGGRRSSHRPNTSIADRRKAGIIEGLTRAEMDSMEIRIPTFDWKQVGGDMDPGTYGGTIATADGDAIDLIEIQPVREHMGDREAKDVGFPFWSKEGHYDLDDLSLADKDVQSAIETAGLGEHLLEMTPEQRAVAIAEACLESGHRSEESNAGWAKDVLGSRKVVWAGSNGKAEGYEYIADEDDTFRRDVLGEDEEDDEHTPNARRYPTLMEGDDVMSQLLDMEAESMDPSGRGVVPDEVSGNLSYNDDLIRVVFEYEGALAKALEEAVATYPTKDDSSEDVVFAAEAPYLVLMTLRGEGVGIWDGDWDHFWSRDDLKKVQALLEKKLGRYAGRISEALQAIVYEAMREAGYGFDDDGYVKLGEGETVGYEFKDSELTPERVEEIVSANGIATPLFWDKAGSRRPLTRGEVDRLVTELGGKFAKNSRGHAFAEGDYVRPGGAYLRSIGPTSGIINGIVTGLSGRFVLVLWNDREEAVAVSPAALEFEPRLKGKKAPSYEYKKNMSAARRWNIFLNGELLDPVYLPVSLTADDAKQKLIREGYDPRIVVDQPPDRRSHMPAHYRTSFRENRRWSGSYMNDLPDSAFLYIEPGGKEDAAGRTVPRSLRHFPYKDQSGKVDVRHLRNALSRIPQSHVPEAAKRAARAHAEKLLAEHGGYSKNAIGRTAREDEVLSAMRSVAADSGSSTGRASIADLSERLSMTKGDLDRVLLDMQRARLIVLYRNDNTAELTPRDHRSAVMVGEHPRHLAYER